MKARTVMLTKMCSFCKTGITYKSEEGMRKGELNGYLHKVCEVAKKKMLKESEKENF